MLSVSANMLTPASAVRTTVPCMRENRWNPQGVEVPYAYPEYLKSSPDYLDGSLVGDAGFDPLCLAAYSWPVFMEKGTALYAHILARTCTYQMHTNL